MQANAPCHQHRHVACGRRLGRMRHFHQGELDILNVQGLACSLIEFLQQFDRVMLADAANLEDFSAPGDADIECSLDLAQVFVEYAA